MGILQPDFTISSNCSEIVVKAPTEFFSRELMTLLSLGNYQVNTSDKNGFNTQVATVLLNQFLPGPNYTDCITDTIKKIFTNRRHMVKFLTMFNKKTFNSNPIKLVKIIYN